ncbi:oligosaccharide repeat unit polymerase [Tsuneonella flava]|uniref:Oligosaccharide repeat unit polymerase n=1 Tax=Tsuneonella flava TaxID=2055955 RepID=A0ABX7KEG7_9SPHN|nr:oligosaccharide repeat unit polymerase [Tsuneonella flava]QSB45025.1 oligosaccharide repeat unit polymerase [Tsuneonella flava]
MIYASLISVVVVHYLLFSKRGIIDPVSVFFLAFLYYSYFAPISMLVFNIYGVDFAGQANYVPMRSINRSAVIFFVGYCGYALSYYCLSRREKFSEYKMRNEAVSTILSDNYTRILLIFVTAIIITIFVFFRKDLMEATGSYEGKISGNYSSSVYAFMMSTAFTLLSLVFNYLILNVKRHNITAAVGIVIFIILSVATYSKVPLIYSALCAFCVLHRYKRIPFAIVMLVLIVGSVVLTLFFIPAFSIYRGSGNFEFRVPNIESFSLVLSEAASPFTIVHLALSGYVNVQDTPLWESFVLWIPRAIWPGRPLDIPEAFAQQVIANWQIGYGLGFSPFAEGYARFGLIGSSLFMAIVGVTTAGMQSLFSSTIPKAMRAPTILTVSGYVSVLALRGSLSNLVTQMIQNWAPVVVASLVALEISRRIAASSPRSS